MQFVIAGMMPNPWGFRGRAPRLVTRACGDSAPWPATAAKLPPSQRRPAPLAERLERGLFELRRDLDLAHLGGEAARPPRLRCPRSTSTWSLDRWSAPNPAIVSCHRVSSGPPKVVPLPCSFPLDFG